MNKTGSNPNSTTPLQSQLLGQMAALCDMTRLRLLHLIERHELGVAELCDVLQLPQSTVSRHLKTLTNQGLAVSRRNGTANLYRMIVAELAQPAQQLWQLAAEQIAQTPAVKQDKLRLTRRLSERRKQAQTFFAGAAAKWDQLRTELYGQAFSDAAIMALLPATWTVADLGCGTGVIAAQLAGYVHKVIGVDQSQAMLTAARKRTGDLDNVELRQGDLEALPLEANEADGTILSIVLTYVTAPDLVIAEAVRVTRPGGKLIIIDLLHHDREDFRRQMGQHWPGFEPQTLISLLQTAHLQRPVCRPLPPEPHAKGPALLLACAILPDDTHNGRYK